MYDNIDAYRRYKKLSVGKLCQNIGVSRTTYYSWQKKGKIPATKLCKMADLFECTTDYLLDRTDKPA